MYWILGLKGSVYTEFTTISLILNLQQRCLLLSVRIVRLGLAPSYVLGLSTVANKSRNFTLKWHYWLSDQWNGDEVQWWHLHGGWVQAGVVGPVETKSPMQNNPLLMWRGENPTETQKKPKLNEPNWNTILKDYSCELNTVKCVSVTPFCESYCWGRQWSCMHFGAK